MRCAASWLPFAQNRKFRNFNAEKRYSQNKCEGEPENSPAFLLGDERQASQENR